jgi:hypothetical protein
VPLQGAGTAQAEACATWPVPDHRANSQPHRPSTFVFSALRTKEGKRNALNVEEDTPKNKKPRPKVGAQVFPFMDYHNTTLAT